MVYVINGEGGKDNVFTFFVSCGGRFVMYIIVSDYDDIYGMMCVLYYVILLRVYVGCFNVSFVRVYFNCAGEKDEDIVWIKALLDVSRNIVRFMDIWKFFFDFYFCG